MIPALFLTLFLTIISCAPSGASAAMSLAAFQSEAKEIYESIERYEEMIFHLFRPKLGTRSQSHTRRVWREKRSYDRLERRYLRFLDQVTYLVSQMRGSPDSMHQAHMTTAIQYGEKTLMEYDG